MADKTFTSKDVFDYILLNLRIAGCHPTKNYFIFQFSCGLSLVINIIWVILLVIRLVYSQEPIQTAAVTFMHFAMFSQVVFKALHIISNHSKFLNLINIIETEFWKSSTFSNPYKIILRTIKTYSIIIHTACFLLCATALFVSPGKFPFNVSFFKYDEYFVRSNYLFAFVYVLQVYSIFGNVLCLVAFDISFMSVVGCCLLQIDMLKKKLMMLGQAKDNEEAFSRLKEVVGHHNIIYKFLQQVESYFTFTILKQFFDSVSIVGVYIYLIQQEFQVDHIFTLITNLTQCFLFSLGGQLIQDQSCGIADAAFECGWENIRDRKIRKELTFIMQRSQRKVQITAGGVMDLSFTTFLAVVKAAFSFLAVLSSTNRNNSK